MRRFLRLLLQHIGTQPRRELIKFESHGCMALDWVEADRGFITGQYSKVIYGGATPVKFITVERADGTTFDCFAAYCHPGTEEMHARLRSPENLIGKTVCVV